MINILKLFGIFAIQSVIGGLLFSLILLKLGIMDWPRKKGVKVNEKN